MDFQELAERYAISGGDIKNAVIKAAAAAAAEPGPDLGKRIGKSHFERATEDVLAARAIMQQSVFTRSGVAAPDAINLLQNVEARWRTAIVMALGLAGTALVAALAAVVLRSCIKARFTSPTVCSPIPVSAKSWRLMNRPTLR